MYVFCKWNSPLESFYMFLKWQYIPKKKKGTVNMYRVQCNLVVLPVILFSVQFLHLHLTMSVMVIRVQKKKLEVKSTEYNV